MSDHRTSYLLPSHYVVEESHKDTDNATQPKQALLMDIPAEPCPQSSSHADCDVSQQLQDSAPKDDFLENSLGSQDNTSQSPETPELEPRSPDKLYPRYISSNIHKHLQNKREPSVPVAFSISVLSRDRRSKAFSSRTADPSNLRPVMHQSKIAVETKCNSIKLAFLNTRSLKNKSFVINDHDHNHKQPGFYVSN